MVTLEGAASCSQLQHCRGGICEVRGAANGSTAGDGKRLDLSRNYAIIELRTTITATIFDSCLSFFRSYQRT